MAILDHVFPGWAAARAEARLRKVRAEVKAQTMKRAFDGAAGGRRNAGWRATGADANAELAPALSVLRNRARDLRRNNPYVAAGVSGIADHMVGHGIVPHPQGGKRANRRLVDLWRDWAEMTACDADGLHDVYGLQHLAAETIIESGEVLVRRYRRGSAAGLPVPLQVRILEPDYLDESKTGELPSGNYIIQGIEFDTSGRRVAYWLFDQHPGATGMWRKLTSQRVPAEDVLHVFLPLRPGQARGYTWLAPVMQRLKNFDEMEDAVIEQAKVAACFAALIQTDEQTAPAAGKRPPLIERIEPAMIERLGPNESVTFGSPPTFNGYAAYSWQALHAIAVGLGVPYELLTGDLKGVNFSSGRMGWLRFRRRIGVCQWRMMVPMLCNGIWRWFLEAQVLTGRGVLTDVPAEWVPPRWQMLDPEAEIKAVKEAIRNGQVSWSEAVREMGYSDPRAHAEQIAADNSMLDELGVVLDCDPRKVGASGAGAAARNEEENGSTVNEDESS